MTDYATNLYRLLAVVRKARPRASLIYALTIMQVAQAGDEGAPQRDLCQAIDGDPNSSAVAQAVAELEKLGVFTVKRSPSRQVGNIVRLSEGKKKTWVN